MQYFNFEILHRIHKTRKLSYFSNLLNMHNIKLNINQRITANTSSSTNISWRVFNDEKIDWERVQD